MSSNAPIGIFDSGIGGLTVAKAIVEALPQEDIIYYGDTAHLPYGDKSAQAIRQYSVGICHFLLEQGCKLIVVACNTASSASYDTLNEYFRGKTLFVDVVEPLAQSVARRGFSKVGVIATKATISSGVYERRLGELAPGLEVVSMATPLLVPMIEEGFMHNRISMEIIEGYLGRPEFDGIEGLLLACTHYPLIRPDIKQYYGGKTEIFDSSQVTAQAVKDLLTERDMLNTERGTVHQFYVSDYTESFEHTTRLFYQEEIKLIHQNIWT